MTSTRQRTGWKEIQALGKQKDWLSRAIVKHYMISIVQVNKAMHV